MLYIVWLDATLCTFLLVLHSCLLFLLVFDSISIHFVTLNLYINSNQLKVYNGEDGRGLRDITLPAAPAEPGTPLSAQPAVSVDEASGVVDVTRSLQRSSLAARRSTSASEVRLDEKVLHCSWHPTNNTIAVAGHAGLCLYKV